MTTTYNDPLSGGTPEGTVHGGIVIEFVEGGGSITFYAAADSAHLPSEAAKTNTPCFGFSADGCIAYNDGTGWAAASLGDDATWPHWG
jgi:hypothetical protein